MMCKITSPPHTTPQFSCCDATDVLTNVPHPASIWMNPACYACFCGNAEADKTLSALLASTNFCLLCIYGPCLRFPLIKCYISSLAHRVALVQNSFSLFSHSFASFLFLFRFVLFSMAFSLLSVCTLQHFYVVLSLPPDLQKLRHLVLESDEQFVLYLQEQAVIFFKSQCIIRTQWSCLHSRFSIHIYNVFAF